MRFHSDDLERAVLSCALMQRDHLTEAVAELEPRDFNAPLRRTLFSSMREMVASGLDVDLVTLVERTKGIEGAEVEIHILDVDLPDPSRFGTYVEQLRELTTRRELHAYALGLQQLTSGEEVGVLAEAQNRLEQIAQRVSGSPRSVDALGLARMISDLGEQDEESAPGVRVGLPDLDAITHGFQPGQLIILAARPGMGKTSLALTMLRKLAFSGAAVAMSSLEMTTRELALRIAAGETGVDYKRLLRKLDASAIEDVVRVGRRLSTVRVEIDDTASLTAPQIAARVYGVKRRLRGLDLLIIDYLQLVQPHTHGDNMATRVGQITGALKRLAKELEVPVLVLSQLSRQCEQRPSKRPILSDLRDSGAIEQDADIVLFLFRPEVYKATEDNFGATELIVAKHRNGETGVIDLRFFGRRMEFRSVSSGGPQRVIGGDRP